MSLMSYREYARHRGCTLRAVQKAVHGAAPGARLSGRIAGAMASDGATGLFKIDSERADALWALHTDEAKRSTLFTPADAAHVSLEHAVEMLARDQVASAFASASASIAPVQTSARGTPGGGDDPANSDIPVDAADAVKASYHESRALRAKIDAENAQLDLDERKAQLLPRDETIRVVATSLRALRDGLRNLAPRVAAQLAACTDVFEIEQLLTDEIDAALSSVTAQAILTDTTDEDDPPDEPAGPPSQPAATPSPGALQPAPA